VSQRIESMSRILYIVPYAKFFPPRNGGHMRCFHILRELARENEVHAIVLQPLSDLRGNRNGYVFPDSVRVYGPAQTPPPRTIFDLLPAKLNSALHYRWLRRSWRGPAEGTILQIYHLLQDILRQVPIDIIIFEHLHGMMASPIARRFRPQSVHILHTYNVDSDLYEQLLRTRNSVTESDASILRQTRWLESNLSRFVDTFWACSEVDRVKLETMNQGRIRGFTIPNGVDTRALQYDNRADKFESREILFCGSLDYAPNGNGLLWFHQSIWPLVHEHLPEMRLVVIGRGETGSKFSALRADSSVDLIGEVESVIPYYQRCGCVIVPLLEGSGTRLKILEAMSLGSPVVSTRIGAEGIEAENGSEILLADTPEEFAAAISRLLADQRMFDAIRRSGRRLVEEKYDWSKIGDKINRVVTKVAHNDETKIGSQAD
jgi:glycosyltransferase involved in cell wall biosynthesis